MFMKYFLIILITLFIKSSAYSQDCTKIDYKKNESEFVSCIQQSQKKSNNFLGKIKNIFTKKNEEIDITSSYQLAIDFECFNICKNAVKGSYTISELNNFCMLQCPSK